MHETTRNLSIEYFVVVQTKRHRASFRVLVELVNFHKLR